MDHQGLHPGAWVQGYPVAGAWGEQESLFGVPDSHSVDAPWELIVQECSADLSCRAWRKPLRGGLYLYKTHAAVERADPADVRVFHMDDVARWARCKRLLPTTIKLRRQHAKLLVFFCRRSWHTLSSCRRLETHVAPQHSDLVLRRALLIINKVLLSNR